MPQENVKFIILLKYLVLFNEKKSPKEIIEEDPLYAEALQTGLQYDGNEHMFGRHYTFWQDLNDQVFASSLKSYEGRVLGIYGGSDIAIVHGLGLERAIDIVNAYHPGQGTFWTIPGTNHHLINISKEENIQVQLTPRYTNFLKERYNEALISDIDNWIKNETP